MLRTMKLDGTRFGRIGLGLLIVVGLLATVPGGHSLGVSHSLSQGGVSGYANGVADSTADVNSYTSGGLTHAEERLLADASSTGHADAGADVDTGAAIGLVSDAKADAEGSVDAAVDAAMDAKGKIEANLERNIDAAMRARAQAELRAKATADASVRAGTDLLGIIVDTAMAAKGHAEAGIHTAAGVAMDVSTEIVAAVQDAAGQVQGFLSGFVEGFVNLVLGAKAELTAEAQAKGQLVVEHTQNLDVSPPDLELPELPELDAEYAMDAAAQADATAEGALNGEIR